MFIIWLSYLFISLCVLGVVFALVKIVVDSKALRSMESSIAQLRMESADGGQNEVSDVPIRLDQENWAEFERKVHNLKQVIVVADIVQEPLETLRDAVIHNFSRGVRYSFIVSRSKAISERNGYLKIFEGLAQIAISKHHLKVKVDELVSIESFEDEWQCVPFVFYRVEDTDAPISAPTRLRTLAFWGDKWFAGIANNYESLPPPVADALATSLMAGAPRPVKTLLEQLEKDTFSAGAEMLETNGAK